MDQQCSKQCSYKLAFSSSTKNAPTLNQRTDTALEEYSRTNKVSIDLVRALYGVQTADKVNKACLVTSSYFTRDAVAFAENQNFMIDLIDGDALHDMIVRSAEKYE